MGWRSATAARTVALMRVLAAHESASRRSRLLGLASSLRWCKLSVAASSAEAAVSVALRRPDLLLLSTAVAARDVSDVARLLAHTSPPPALVVGTSDAAGSGSRSEVAPPAPALSADARLCDELATILSVFSDTIATGPGSVTGVDGMDQGSSTADETDADDTELNDAEYAVLNGLAGGASTDAIAAQLGLPEDAVDLHVARTLRKLHRRCAPSAGS